jgi:hypothetical protein
MVLKDGSIHYYTFLREEPERRPTFKSKRIYTLSMLIKGNCVLSLHRETIPSKN